MFAIDHLDIPPLQRAGGTVSLPGSKSISNRVLLLAALSTGHTDVVDLLDSDDTQVMLQALRQLGCRIEPQADGALRVHGLGGELPVTTHGGLLSGGHPGLGGGFFHVLEGVRQVRADAGARQVPGAKVALVHGNGGVISVHCTLLLGSEAAA